MLKTVLNSLPFTSCHTSPHPPRSLRLPARFHPTQHEQPTLGGVGGKVWEAEIGDRIEDTKIKFLNFVDLWKKVGIHFLVFAFPFSNLRISISSINILPSPRPPEVSFRDGVAGRKFFFSPCSIFAAAKIEKDLGGCGAREGSVTQDWCVKFQTQNFTKFYNNLFCNSRFLSCLPTLHSLSPDLPPPPPLRLRPWGVGGKGSVVENVTNRKPKAESKIEIENENLSLENSGSRFAETEIWKFRFSFASHLFFQRHPLSPPDPPRSSQFSAVAKIQFFNLIFPESNRLKPWGVWGRGS